MNSTNRTNDYTKKTCFKCPNGCLSVVLTLKMFHPLRSSEESFEMWIYSEGKIQQLLSLRDCIAVIKFL